MSLPFYIVDVFADKKYAGNQLAVFLEAQNLSSEQMQQIAREINFAESTFVTKLDRENNKAEIRIFTPAQEMQFAGHPIIGTSWVLMNKIFDNSPSEIKLEVPIGPIAIQKTEDLIWLKAAQPKFWDVFSKVDFTSFSNLQVSDFENQFPIQEVTTGSAFVLVPLSSKKALENLVLDKDKADQWMKNHCKTDHRGLYFYYLEGSKVFSRLLYVQHNQLMEDAATGSASTCLQASLLKNHLAEIEIVNYQGDYIGRPSEIYFKGKLTDTNYDINIGGKAQFVAKGEWEA
ncbi:PhzF family phenazine biosynthesis protein [Flavobacterium johnsoniae]|jgi:trans-2,3-dihydro-3-hydroxyanthranilate isomerase|uniref:Phenazine biosynthesis protein PhzF family n=1 Tax=Flavobacterium johnsoniae (strain ATCC 17061 / DSM 2064 / JCM 8514 / BCRC 14874 / CCUG 350202 / NBRC 14942 / NCIMB 11054 / UW101) TaxID=376686 RepID=A5FHN5_FLAJ1|nr:PhzF family phenazine biosynthesis protein [Flavobacterium johnsoniae]ABQ05275.1 phenazine biosynthesis protein PhzF family [Flavobacterium johnsoniae UW101]OXE96984.1 phenazine biosynthesis protein PhzF [Flavobacterium johnsoniae UW101]WQG82923.1 PhzF family phenazine biosynthesis protein [Flavobacterium johnsoniae UW101]SHL61532.1 trans-2,3-dihydro-3-hydroxyanthranilate isomerase [Flavobacterium johnsoniae]